MKVTVAGYNVDKVLIDAVKDGALPEGEAFTPETLSAAYARISRSPDTIDKLRSKARKRVAQARASNEKIVFEYGHQTIAEHAVLNFDIEGVSRYLIEFIEHSRLASYTEKSQRYITFTKGAEEFVIPREIAQAGLTQDYVAYIGDTHAAYHRILNLLKDKPRPEGGTPQEDARYVTTLAVIGQLGMTLNARALEQMIRRLNNSNNLAEAWALADALLYSAQEIIPSLVRYTQEDVFQRDLPERIRLFSHANTSNHMLAVPGVSLITHTGAPNSADEVILTALVHSISQASYDICKACVQAGDTMELTSRAFKCIYEDMQVWNAAPRALEFVDLTFEVVTSAACFGQLKRHRMATLLPQAYDLGLGYTIPGAIAAVPEAMAVFEEIMGRSRIMADDVAQHCNDVAPYVLTQAHRRRSLLKMNARELYHFSRLRQDKHAQWEIRQLADKIIAVAKRVIPNTMLLACGKDAFPQLYKEIYGSEP